MGRTNKRLFLSAGIVCLVFSGISILSFIFLNFIFKDYFIKVLEYFENTLGDVTMFDSYKMYFNSVLITKFVVNLVLGIKYVQYGRMNIRTLATRGGGMLFTMLFNILLGGSFIAFILVIIAMSKPIKPQFNDKDIKEIDSKILDNNPNTVARILRIKQDKLNGLLSDEEYKIKLNEILDDETRRYL